MNTSDEKAKQPFKKRSGKRFFQKKPSKMPQSLRNDELIEAFLKFKDSGGTEIPKVSAEVFAPKKTEGGFKKRPRFQQKHKKGDIGTGGDRGFSKHPQKQSQQNQRSKDLQIVREGEQRFVLKPAGRSPKTFPYLTPKQAFERYIPHPKEHSKVRAAKGVLRVIPFGGCEQVGLNCVGFEYNGRVVLVDLGIQFPDEHMFGVQGRIPDITYLKDKVVDAVFITHGHIDHIGAVPQIMKILGPKVPVYAPAMAKELIEAKMKDYKFPVRMEQYKVNQIIPVGEHFYIEPFTVDHSIPDSCGLRIHTPVGKFIHTGDWKFDNDPRDLHPVTDHDQLKQFGKEGIRALLSDSTNAHLPGSSMAERTVIEPLENIFAGAKGRIFTGTFSSIVDRLQIIIEASEKCGRKVVFLGRGMQTYVTIAKKLGYLKSKPGTLIDMAEADNLPDEQVCICCTGAQGERYAALMRIATGESKDSEFKSGDTVVLSSSVIPGNERKVQELMDLLAEQGVEIHHYRQSNIHSGGHAREEDVKQMIEEIQPEIFVPIYGHRFMLHANADIARGMGYSEERIMIPRNGQIMEFTATDSRLTDYFASHRTVTIDGNMVGYTDEAQMLERYQMSKGGVVIVNMRGGRQTLQVYILTHGFLNMNAMPEFRDILVKEVKEYYAKSQSLNHTRDEMNRAIRKRIQHVIWTQLGKEPVVIVAS